MPTPITIDANVNLDFRSATTKANAFQKQFAQGFQRAGGLKGITAEVNNFDNALGRATSRIVSLGAAAVVFNTLRRSFGAFAEATVDVEQALTRINVNLGQSADGLKQFSSQIFNIARATGTTFEDAAKGAEELARQGLGAEETLKRLKDALILSRVAGIDSASAVDSLTAAINSFNREALTSTDVVNRFAAVDTKFAVSTRDLEEAVSRVGSSASEAGVSFNQLLAVVTSVQQTTARGGAVIGNALKTIFTRIGRPEVLDDLQAIGVAVKDVEGNTLPAIQVLQNLSRTYDDLSASQKNVVSRQVAGTFQINILKAALADLNKQQSTYNGALKAAATAGDAAIQKNEALNKTLQSLITNTGTSIKQLFSSLGSQDIAPFTKGLLDGIEKVRAVLSGDTGSEIGKSIGDGLLKGIANVLTGPGLAALAVILAKGLGKVVATIGSEAKGLLGINDASAKRAEIQSRINTLLKGATSAELANLQAARSVLAAKEQILAISARIRQTELIGTPLQNAFLGAGALGGPKITGPKKVGSFAKGHMPNFADPLFEAIKREKAAGVPEHLIYIDRDKRVASADNPQGLLVANKRDEPAGGFQGVDRAISEGRDPKKVGTRPNFAATPPSRAEQARASQEVRSLFGELSKIKQLGPDFERVGSQIFDASKKLNKVAQDNALGKLAKESLRLQFAAKIVGDQSRKSSVPNPTIDPGAATLIAQQNRYFASKRTTSETDPFFGGGGRKSRAPSVAQQRESFLSEQINSRRSFAFGRAQDKFVTGGTITPAQRNLIKEELRQQASQEASKRFAPGTSSTVKSAFAKNRANISFAELESQRTEFTGNRARVAAQERASVRRNRINNGTLAAAFILPAAAGFIPQGEGGTKKGIGFGAASGALQGAGIGAIFGPLGAAIGGVGGGLIGAFLKLQKSTEEVATEINQQASVRNSENEAIARTIALQEQLNDAIKEGADSSVIDKLGDQLRQSRSGVVSSEGRSVIGIKDDKQRTIAQNELAAKDARTAASNQAKLTLRNGAFVNELSSPTESKRSGNEELAQLFRQAITDEDAKKVSDEQILLLQKIAAGTFNVKPIGGGGDEFGVRAPRSNQSAIDKAAQDFKDAADKLSPLAKLTGAKPEDINKTNINAIALALTRSIVGKRSDIAASAQDKKDKEAAQNRLSRNAFIGAPNLEAVGRAASVNRNPSSNRGDRAQANFDILTELSGTNAFGKGTIEETPAYKAATAGVQEKNVGDLVIQFLRNNNPSVGTLRDNRGNPQLTSMERYLKSIAESGSANAAIAKLLLPVIPQLKNNLSDAKVPDYRYPDNFKASDSGSPFGISATSSTSKRGGNFITKDNVAAAVAQRNSKYNFITKDTVESLKPAPRDFDLKKAVPEEKTEDAKPKQVDINIQGAVNLIAQGVDANLAVLLTQAVNDAVNTTTATYIKSLQPQLKDLQVQVGKLSGQPVVPSFGANKNFNVPAEAAGYFNQ